MEVQTHFSSKKELTQYVQDQAKQFCGFSEVKLDLKLPKLNNEQDALMHLLLTCFQLLKNNEGNAGKGMVVLSEEGGVCKEGDLDVASDGIFVKDTGLERKSSALEKGEPVKEKGVVDEEKGVVDEEKGVLAKEKGVLAEVKEVKTLGSVRSTPEKGVVLGEEPDIKVIGERGPNPARGRATVKPPVQTPRRRRDSSGKEYNWNIAGSSSMRKDMIHIQNRIKVLESQVDKNSHRLRKATLVASSSELRGWQSELKRIQGDKNSNVSELERILILINRKYAVEVTDLEIFANHWLPNGCYILKFVYRNTDNSCWQRLIEAMRKGGDKNFNFYLNFNLTRKRLSLFKTVRNLKKDGKIALWSVDCNGTISIMHLNERWQKLTHHYSKEGDLIPTFSDKAVIQLFD
jgi:hypothetical protein